jgi:hypothetical protein
LINEERGEEAAKMENEMKVSNLKFQGAFYLPTFHYASLCHRGSHTPSYRPKSFNRDLPPPSIMKDFGRRLFPPDLMALALVIGLSVDCIIHKGVHAVKTGVSPRTSRT